MDRWIRIPAPTPQDLASLRWGAADRQNRRNPQSLTRQRAVANRIDATVDAVKTPCPDPVKHVVLGQSGSAKLVSETTPCCRGA
jgi:hypothetical protein